MLLKHDKLPFNKGLWLFLIIVILFWLKSYFVYLVEFNLGVKGAMQQFLLFINPISSSILLFGVGLFFKGRKQQWVLLAINAILSFLLFANVGYYRFFNDFITLPVLFQTQNFGKISGSVGALLEPYDILYFADTFILFIIILMKYVKPMGKVKGRSIELVYLAGFILLSTNILLANIDRPQLLTRTFDRNYIVKYLGVYNFTVYDIIQSTRSSAQRVMADSNDIVSVKNYISAKYTPPNPEYFGATKGMNVVYISMESFQNFLIDFKLNGEEVTPFLNSLIRDQNTIYFKNFFQQTAQGKTSDSEFLMENSLYPLPQGSVFTTKAQNTYQGLPAIIKDLGYYTSVFHGNNKTFWNREEMYKSLGYDMFYDSSYYTMNEENVLNYGLEDKPFFKETMLYLKTLPQPFYAKLITLTNHFPYPLDVEDQTIAPADTGDGTVDRYFQTTRYLDEALKQYFDDMKEAGLDKNTMVVLYGDHYGISENRKEPLTKLLGKEIGDFEQAQLQRVPLIIYAPGLKGFINETYGGQIDVLPTILRLLGVDTKNQVIFGSDLLSNQREQIVPFRNGDFVTDHVTSVKGRIYDNQTGQVIEDSVSFQRYSNMVKNELQFSDLVVYGYLLRFHPLEGMEPINRNLIDYSKAKHLNKVIGIE